MLFELYLSCPTLMRNDQVNNKTEQTDDELGRIVANAWLSETCSRNNNIQLGSCD